MRASARPGYAGDLSDIAGQVLVARCAVQVFFNGRAVHVVRIQLLRAFNVRAGKRRESNVAGVRVASDNVRRKEGDAARSASAAVSSPSRTMACMTVPAVHVHARTPAGAQAEHLVLTVDDYSSAALRDGGRTVVPWCEPGQPM